MSEAAALITMQASRTPSRDPRLSARLILRGTGARRRAQIGTVLVPTDFSEQSLTALEYAAALLRRFAGTLHLVHVAEPDYSYAVPALLTLPPSVPTTATERHNRVALKKLAKKYSAATPPLHMPTGRAFDQICKVASEITADLIVISTHGYGGVKHLLLGSTAERVVRHSPCPVLVVRAQKQEGAEPIAKIPKQEPRIARILVPIDFSACATIRAGVRRSGSIASM